MSIQYPEIDVAKLEGTLVFTSPTASGNAVGRVLRLAELADQVVAQVLVVAPDDGPVWTPATRWTIPVLRIGKEIELADLGAPGYVDWIWVVKPMAKGWRLAKQLADRHPEAPLLIDIDDEDEQLSREFIERSLVNRLKLNRLRQLHPARIARVRKQALAEVDGISTSSFALAKTLQLNPDQVLRIPHVRRRVACGWESSWSEGQPKRIGFFGTVREHKGINNIAKLMQNDPAVVLHAFEGPDWPAMGIDRARVVEYPVDEPHKNLFPNVDVVTLPQQRLRGAEVQLPMKLIDAMAGGVPVMATPTQAIMEVAGDSIRYVSDWSDPTEVQQALESCLREGESLGRAVQERFDEQLSMDALAPQLNALLDQLRSDHAVRRSMVT